MTSDEPFTPNPHPVMTSDEPVVASAAPGPTAEAPLKASAAHGPTPEEPLVASASSCPTPEAPLDGSAAPCPTPEAPLEASADPGPTPEAPLEASASAGPIIATPLSPDRVLLRLRRLGALFRALLIAQITAGFLLLVIGLLEWFMPGVLPQLFRGHVTAWPVILSLAGLLLALDLASAVTELKMGQTLGVERTLFRRMVTTLSFVPGLLLLRRLLILALSILWLVLLFAMLALWVAAMILLALPMRLLSGLVRGPGRTVDLIDLALSEFYSLATRGLAALSASPVHRVGDEVDVVLRLLHRRRQGSAVGGQEPPGQARREIPNRP